MASTVSALAESARALSGKSENGWWFFLLSPSSRRSLSDVFQEYVDRTSADVEDEPSDEDDDEEDDELIQDVELESLGGEEGS